VARQWTLLAEAVISLACLLAVIVLAALIWRQVLEARKNARSHVDVQELLEKTMREKAAEASLEKQ